MLLASLLCLPLAACSNENDTPSSGSPSATSSLAAAGSSEKETDEMDIPFEARLVRVGSSQLGERTPVTATAKNKAELQAFFDSYAEKLSLTDEYADPAFADAVAGYGDDFFTDKMLVLVLLEEGSGSVTHEVEKVQQKDKALLATIRRNDIPDGMAGTMDMAQWVAFIELDASHAGLPASAEVV